MSSAARQDVTSERRLVAAFASVGVAIAAASSVAPITYDEGDWLAVARRLALGDVLYRDIVDNKSPPIYWLMRALDVIPGPFQLARGVFMGVVVVLLGTAARGLAVRLGVPPRPATRLGIGVSLAAALQSVLVLNIELGAAALLMASLLAVAHRRGLLGGIVSAAAVVIDPRALLLVVGVLVFAGERGGRRLVLRTLLGASTALGWIAFLALSPDARYAVVELNAATRGTLSEWRPLEVFAVALIASLPVVAAFIATTGSATREAVRALRGSRSGVVLLAGAVLVSLGSAFPFYKYWILLLPSLPLLVAACYRAGVARPNRMPRGVNPGILIVLALLPVGAHGVRVTTDQSRRVARYQQAAEELDRVLGPHGTFVSFDTQPFLTTFRPQRSILPWAVQDFLAVENSRRRANFAAVSAAIARTDVVVDDGVLSAGIDDVAPGYRPLWLLFRSRIGEFRCVRTIQGLSFHFRAQRCQ